MTKTLTFILTLLVSMTANANSCPHERQQSRELRVKTVDDKYRLDLNLNGRWSPLLTAQEKIEMPRLALERAEVAFLLQVEGKWTLQLLSLTGSSLQLGELSEKPARMCFDENEQNLYLVSKNEATTPLPLPTLP